jgi:uncharacterized membrane protein YfcA
MFNEMILMLIGGLGGLSMGIIGVGAGIITIPLLILFGLNLRTAVGCALIMQLIPQTLPAVILYHKENYINYYFSILVVIGSLIGTYIGAYIVSNKYISEHISHKILAVFLLIISFYYAYKYLLTEKDSSNFIVE